MTLRVLVVEDSTTVRKYIVDVLESHGGFDIVGEASDGRAAIELCQTLRPDVVTMDMMLPVMSGVAATEYIMAYCPTPILIVSASTNRGELFKTYEALAAGAVDVLDKPDGRAVPDNWDQRLVAAVQMVARIRVITHPRARLRDSSRLAPRAVPEASPRPSTRPRAIGIGASTGGPGALLVVLSSLPANLAVPILLVVHISEPFGRGLSEWLDSQTGFTVRYPHDGERLPTAGGSVLMAPPDRHLELVGERLRLSDAPLRHSCRPSVDVLFESMAAAYGGRAVGCLLTGMGKDGAQGLLAIRQKGGATVAQDEATSVIFGMPGEAVRLGAASLVKPLAEIGPTLGALVMDQDSLERTS